MVLYSCFIHITFIRQILSLIRNLPRASGTCLRHVYFAARLLSGGARPAHCHCSTKNLRRSKPQQQSCTPNDRLNDPVDHSHATFCASRHCQKTEICRIQSRPAKARMPRHRESSFLAPARSSLHTLRTFPFALLPTAIFHTPLPHLPLGSPYTLLYHHLLSRITWFCDLHRLTAWIPERHRTPPPTMRPSRVARRHRVSTASRKVRAFTFTQTIATLDSS